MDMRSIQNEAQWLSREHTSVYLREAMLGAIAHGLERLATLYLFALMTRLRRKGMIEIMRVCCRTARKLRAIKCPVCHARLD
jgi:hypothetical protein